MKNHKFFILGVCLAGCMAASCGGEKDNERENDVPNVKTACKTNDDCADPLKPICSDAGICTVDTSKTECTDNAGCTKADKPVCSALGTCIPEGFELECIKDSDCKRAQKPVCSAVGTCIAEGSSIACAKDADCASAVIPVCSLVGSCVAENTTLECTKDADCADPKKDSCNMRGQCETLVISCEQDADCPDSDHICVENACVLQHVCDMVDTDGDTIADIYEGRDFEDDSKSAYTDRDGVPDYKDADSDGDTIPDRIEGGTNGCSGAEPIDSDGDTIPDFRSSDSDGNGIPDMYEGCPMDGFVYIGSESPKKDKNNPEHVCKTPADTDGDTIPDYRSFDNDGDGISDEEEIVGLIASSDDVMNGTFSGDCDGDGKHDPIGSADAPIDCDGDTIPDYMDNDSDGDTIPDRVENRYIVTDVYARYSLDADGDGMPDSDEAGDDPNNPRDADGDTIPDYLDLDSDNDGLSDAFEYARRDEGFNYLLADTDGDGASDLVEFGAGTNPADPDDNPKTRGNFVFITPYQEESTPKRETLSFDTGIQTVDIYFSIDASNSMSDEIATLKDNLNNMLKSLQCSDLGRDCESNIDCKDIQSDGADKYDAICSEKHRCIVSPKSGTDGKGCFADMWTGVGKWGDIKSFKNLSALSGDLAATKNALDHITDPMSTKQNSIQPSMCAVYGSESGCTSPNCYSGSDSADRFGCVGFRKGSVKMYVQAGDAQNHDVAGYAVKDAKSHGPKLKADQITYIGLFGREANSPLPSPYLWWNNEAYSKGIAQMACYAGSCSGGVCGQNCDSPTEAESKAMYVAYIDNVNINTVVRDMLLKIAQEKEIHITTEVVDIDENAAKLVDHLEVNTSGATVNNRICTEIDASKIVSQQYPMINGMKPSTTLCFDVIPVENQEVIAPQADPKVYRARVNVLGNGSVLNSGIAYFLVPSKISQTIIN